MSSTLNVSGGITGTTRTGFTAETSIAYPLPFETMRVWDAYQTNLPSIGAADDIGLATGTFGTALPYLKSQDMNAAGPITEYARTTFTFPPEYVAGGTVQIRFAAGMLTSTASVSATVDAEAYLSARTTLVSGSDLVTTTATSINSVTFAEKLFTVNASGLSPGSILDIRIAIIANSATASSHFAAIAACEILCTVKG